MFFVSANQKPAANWDQRTVSNKVRISNGREQSVKMSDLYNYSMVEKVLAGHQLDALCTYCIISEHINHHFFTCSIIMKRRWE